MRKPKPFSALKKCRVNISGFRSGLPLTAMKEPCLPRNLKFQSNANEFLLHHKICLSSSPNRSMHRSLRKFKTFIKDTNAQFEMSPSRCFICESVAKFDRHRFTDKWTCLAGNRRDNQINKVYFGGYFEKIF